MKEIALAFFIGAITATGMTLILTPRQGANLSKLTLMCEHGVLKYVTTYENELTPKEKFDRIRFIGNACLEYAQQVRSR